MIRAIFILLLISICSHSAWAQSSRQRNDTIYVDQFKNPTTIENASYYIIRKNIKNKYDYSLHEQKMYYLNHVLYDSCISKHEFRNPNRRSPYRIGKDATYYPNGKLKSVYTYESGEKKGEYTLYHSNGNIKLVGYIDNYKKYFYSYYDLLGNSLLTNGSGFITEFDSTLNTFLYYQVRDSVVMLNYYVDDFYQDTIYHIIDTEFEPPQGMDILIKQIADTFNKYNFSKYQGQTIKVELIIFENGEIGRINFVNPISDKYKKIITERLKELVLFNPPKLRDGRSVKVIRVLPLKII